MSRPLVPAMLTLALLCGSAPGAADPDLWLHVRVDEGDATKVEIHLPFRLIGTALPMIDIGGHIHERSIHIDDHHLSYADIRDLWRQVRRGPDMTFVTIEEHDESVRIWKRDGYFHVRIRDRGNERVDVRMPLGVVDALMGAEDDFDLDAAVAALVEHGVGELVEIRGDDETVRVWIDREPESAS